MSPRAQAEFESQLVYLLDRSPKGAKTWAKEFKIAIQRLASGPEKHGLAPEDSDHEQEIRQTIFKTRKELPYRLIFTMRGTEIHVLSIRGTGQNYTEFG